MVFRRYLQQRWESLRVAIYSWSNLVCDLEISRSAYRRGEARRAKPYMLIYQDNSDVFPLLGEAVECLFYLGRFCL